MKLAIIQQGPEYNNLSKSIKLFESILIDVVKENVDLVVFGESWLCGYPAWLDYCPEASYWNHPPVKETWKNMFDNSLEVESQAFEQIQGIIKTNKVNVVLGANEAIRKGKGNGSLFNAVFTFNRAGDLLNHHRKLMPTYTEKLVHATGDGHGLNAVDLDFGRMGSLICWEHWMPLTRQAMHDQGEDLHIALWPYVKEMHIIASRQYAFEGRCHVVSVGQLMKTADTPKGLKIPDHLDRSNQDELVLKGGSCIIGPDGQFILEPKYNEQSIIYQEIKIGEGRGEFMNLSVSGHYQRPDVFELSINKKRYF
jgi:predicted amidohydrolase